MQWVEILSGLAFFINEKKYIRKLKTDFVKKTPIITINSSLEMISTHCVKGKKVFYVSRKHIARQRLPVPSVAKKRNK